jgi:3-oxoacyl-[acyl-carrier-protein] synthase-3
MLEHVSAPARPRTRRGLRGAGMLGIGTALPPRVVTSAEVAGKLDIGEDWIVSRTGIRERRRAEPDARLSDYAARAGRAALAQAGVPASELDLVLVATLTQDEITPNTAPIVAHELGARRAGAIDVGAACTAFLSGLALGSSQIESGRAELILLIGADFVTRITDYDDKRSAPLFADAAGAVVLGRGGGELGAIGPIILGADGSHAETIIARHEDRLIRMDGPEVFRNAVNRMATATEQAVARAGIALEDVDVFVYHQANARITRAVGERLGLDAERVVDCIEMLGNASAATLPVALSIAEREGRLRPGARVLLSAFGAGFTWGAGVIEWGGDTDGA